MEPREAYNDWAAQYDSNENKTRDLEAISLRDMLGEHYFDNCLELGCGTGKNTTWLSEKSKAITAVDYSIEMLTIAKSKINSDRVEFIYVDLKKDWPFAADTFDLVTFSLVMEHFEDLDPIFGKVQRVLQHGGFLYIGELHPFKQYLGSKARFESNDGVRTVECYNHHISDFIYSAEKNGLTLLHLKEYFDEGNRNSIPRIISMLFKK
jgi:ubiquinone/menaquinone biosynthesis C-methylase UbiE